MREHRPYRQPKDLKAEVPKTMDEKSSLMEQLEVLAHAAGLRIIPTSGKLFERIQRNVDHKLEMADLQDLLVVDRLTATNGNNLLVSTILADWIVGTLNQIAVTDDGGGTVTLSLASPALTTINSSTYTVLVANKVLHITYTATGTVAVTLPTALLSTGQHFRFKDAGGNASVNNITLQSEGAALFDGSATAVIAGDYDAVSIYPDGSNWFLY